MTSHIDELLKQACLVPRTYSQRDIDAGEARIAERTGYAPIPGSPADTAAHTPEPGAGNVASQDLAALCETVVATPGP